jgi:hypothetical protein
MSIVFRPINRPMCWGGSGTREEDPLHTRRINAYFALMVERHKIMKPGDRWFHGACRGADIASAWAAKRHGLRVTAVVPHDRSFVAPDWAAASDDALVMASGTTYEDRNAVLVDHVDWLTAWPLKDINAGRRSGTWQAVRMAFRRGIPCEVHVLTQAEEQVLRRASWPFFEPVTDLAPHRTARP